MRFLDRMFVLPGGVFLLLLIAAALEVLGDAFFQTAVHHSSGLSRWLSSIGGAVILSLYGLLVNLPDWNFGRLLGAYVVFFFLVAQVVAKVRFHQPISAPVLVGGCLIIGGGLIISLWK